MDSQVLIGIIAFGLVAAIFVIRYFMRKAVNKATDSIENAIARRKNANNTQGPTNLSDMYGGQNNDQKED